MTPVDAIPFSCASVSPGSVRSVPSRAKSSASSMSVASAMLSVPAVTRLVRRCEKDEFVEVREQILLNTLDMVTASGVGLLATGFTVDQLKWLLTADRSAAAAPDDEGRGEDTIGAAAAPAWR